MTLNELETLLEEFPIINRRFPDWFDCQDVSLEADDSFLERNKKEAIWFLENQELIHEALANYFEGKRPSE